MEGAIGGHQFNFTVEIPLRRPRPWERAPKSPHKSHRRGKKVWKRHEVRPKEAAQTSDTGANEDAVFVIEEAGSTPGRRPVKRLRNAPQKQQREGAPDDTHYTATLRDKAPGTPKSRLISSV